MSPTSDSFGPLVISVSRRIDAPAHDIFEVLRDPRRHHEFDGSSMVRSSDAQPVNGVGDHFVMRMFNEDFGAYEMRSEVVEFVNDRTIIWAPERYDVEEESWGHRWGWHLTPTGEATEVIGIYDVSRVPEEGLRVIDDGEWGRPILNKSLERLNSLFTNS